MIEKKEPVEIIMSESGKKRHLIDNLLKTKSIYIAVLTKDYFNDEKCILEAKDAATLGLKMYGMAISGTKLPKQIRKLPWMKLIFLDNSIQMSLYMKQLIDKLNQDKS